MVRLKKFRITNFTKKDPASHYYLRVYDAFGKLIYDTKIYCDKNYFDKDTLEFYIPSDPKFYDYNSKDFKKIFNKNENIK